MTLVYFPFLWLLVSDKYIDLLARKVYYCVISYSHPLFLWFFKTDLYKFLVQRYHSSVVLVILPEHNLFTFVYDILCLKKFFNVNEDKSIMYASLFLSLPHSWVKKLFSTFTPISWIYLLRFSRYICIQCIRYIYFGFNPSRAHHCMWGKVGIKLHVFTARSNMSTFFYWSVMQCWL